ncbi:MAG: COG4705 family protein [Solirubrobacteraceae bacterium]
MNAIATSPSTSLTGRKMLNKVPEVTLYFWLIKVLCTTVGETAADYLSTNVGWGADTTMAATGGLLAALLIIQFSRKRYVASAYWACVVVISVFGTQITDKLTDTYNVPLTTTTTVFAAILALVFAAWYTVERTLSIHSILTVRREAFYWLAILFTFALGTAAGDLVAEKFTLGYAVSVAAFAGVIAIVALAHFRFGLNAVLSFWLAYIMTRPLGASIGDFMSQNDPQAGGMNLGTTATSYVFLGLILVMVAYLQVTKRDRTPTEVVAAKPDHGRHHSPHTPRPPHHHRRPHGRSELASQEG